MANTSKSRKPAQAEAAEETLESANVESGDPDTETPSTPVTTDTQARPEHNADTKQVDDSSSVSLVPPPSPYAVVSGKDVDEVSLSAAVYKNIKAKKSLTVHHIQRRLEEWGFVLAASDKDGFYGDLTSASVSAFQKAQGLEPTGLMDWETMNRLFEGDQNVRVVA